MYPYFVRLKNKHNFSDCSMSEHRVSYGKNISYKKAESIHRDKIFDVILEEWRYLFGLNIMVITGPVLPHTDSKIKSCINFYVETDNATTRFFEPINEDLDTKWQIKNQTDGFNFEYANLKEVCQFTAEPGDAIALNVAKIHDVTSLNPINKRVALTLASSMKFENLCKILYATGNLEINKRITV